MRHHLYRRRRVNSLSTCQQQNHSTQSVQSCSVLSSVLTDAVDDVRMFVDGGRPRLTASVRMPLKSSNARDFGDPSPRVRTPSTTMKCHRGRSKVVDGVSENAKLITLTPDALRCGNAWKLPFNAALLQRCNAARPVWTNRKLRLYTVSARNRSAWCVVFTATST